MEDMSKSSKLEDIQNEDCRCIQPYFLDKSVSNTRLAYRIRTKMVEKIPGNYKNMFKKSNEGLKCSHCEEDVMTQIHCVSCPGFKLLREGLDLTCMADMVVYFRRVMVERSRK